MKSPDTNAGKAPRTRKGRPVADFLKPRIIEAQGNEEFLDRVAAIFAEQVLAAQAQERRDEQAPEEQAQEEQAPEEQAQEEQAQEEQA